MIIFVSIVFKRVMREIVQKYIAAAILKVGQIQWLTQLRCFVMLINV